MSRQLKSDFKKKKKNPGSKKHTDIFVYVRNGTNDLLSYSHAKKIILLNNYVI